MMEWFRPSSLLKWQKNYMRQEFHMNCICSNLEIMDFH